MTLNIATLFEGVADALPDRVILTCDREQRSYSQLEVRANRLAHHLQAVGVRPGDHVAVHMRNRIEYVECVLACLKARAVPINVNYRYTEAELVHVYDNSQSVALIRTSSARWPRCMPSNAPTHTTLPPVARLGPAAFRNN